VTGITSPWYGVHTVNSGGELIYIDKKYNINKLSTDNTTVTTLLEYTSPWISHCVYCSPSTGQLMVAMSNSGTAMVTLYSDQLQPVLTMQHDNTGHPMYGYPQYITENRNGDIIVSDFWRGVVVTERGGRHRFSYTGPPSGSGLSPSKSRLDPRGICTDALSHILVCDFRTHTVQMIDKDGHFLSLLLTEQHGIYQPYSLNYDDKTHLLWVGSFKNPVCVYRYIQRRQSVAGKY
jgi:DNA-binding beta-propeller fold protein YncE